MFTLFKTVYNAHNEHKVKNHMKVFFSPLALGTPLDIHHLSKIHCDGYHLDVMDRTVVSNFCRHDYIIPDLKSLKKPIQVHLMGSQKLINPICIMGPDIIFIHPKWCEDFNKAVLDLQKHGVKVGIVWDADEAEQYFDLADEVLFMTVVPGFSGQDLIKSRLERIRQILPNKPTWIDGGVNQTSIKYLDGVTGVIVGSGISTLR